MISVYELISVGEQTYYIDCPAKIGVVRTAPDGVYLIDSGNDKDAGKKVLRILEQNGWSLLGILNTHSHADHIGGNHYLQGQTGCPVFSGGCEAALISRPLLEPASLYGGFPPPELRHKFLLARESAVTDFSDPAFPKEIQALPLPGHSFDMIGFRTPDNIVFLGDCLSSPATLEKYGIPFLCDVESHLHTLDAVEQMEAALFIPAHADPVADCRPLTRLNREKVLELGDAIVSFCTVPCTAEEMLSKLFDFYHLRMSFEQYALLGSTLRSYLTWLKNCGRVTALIESNAILWQATV